MNTETVAQYIARNGLSTTNVDELDSVVLYGEEQSDCVHVYVQPGFYVIATLADE